MQDSSTDPTVRTRDVLPVVVVAPILTWAATTLFGWLRWDAPIAIGAAAVSAALIGVPVWFWAADNNRGRLLDRIVLGAGSGLMPVLLAGVSGALGLVLRSRSALLAQVLAHGLPIPSYGVALWGSVALWALGAIVVGAGCGAIQWTISRN